MLRARVGVATPRRLLAPRAMPEPDPSKTVADVSAMLTATATIVASTATLANASNNNVALVGAVASMVGASATLAGHVLKQPNGVAIVEVVSRVRSERKGVLLSGLPVPPGRRLDVRIVADIDTVVSIGDCTFDGDGPPGVYVDGLHEDAYLHEQCLEALELTVVGIGRGFSRTRR